MSSNHLAGGYLLNRYDHSRKFVNRGTAERLNCTRLQKGDILIARLPDPLGRACIFPFEGDYITAVDVAVLRIPSNAGANIKYIMHMINSPQIRAEIKKYESGTTRKRISRKNLDKIQFQLPSLSEQQRIVDRIEELFSQLDSGVETLRKTKQQLAVYRQAVLKEAFAFDNQSKTQLAQILDDIHIGPFGTMLHKEDYVQNGIPVINPQHIKNQAICESGNVTITSEKANELQTYMLCRNDVIMGRRGEMGRTAAVTEREAGWICGTGSIILRLNQEYDAALYTQILSSPSVVHYLEENATGTTMKNLNEDIVKHIPVPKIDRHQQTQIMSKLDVSLSVCGSIERTVDTALQQAEALRQSILRDAFEGEL